MKKAQIGTTVLLLGVVGLSGYKLAHQYRQDHKAIVTRVEAPVAAPTPKVVPKAIPTPTATTPEKTRY